MRGSNGRYFEDVVVGQELTPSACGPLSLMDTMGFLVSCGHGHTHGLVLEEALLRHPGHFFHNAESGGGIEYTGIGDHRSTIAKSVSAPGTYDYGPQCIAWVCSLVTSWMGDHAVLKRLRAEMRWFNTLGDVAWCGAGSPASTVRTVTR